MRSVGSTVIALLFDVFEHCPGRLLRARRAAQVGRAQAPGECAFNARFYSRSLAFQAEAVAQQHRRRQEHRQRVGDALPGDVGRGAVHRLEQAGGAVRVPISSEALGSMPIEPVSIAASSERMSPNMFSVRITSKCRGAEIELHGGVVDEHMLELDVRELARVQLADDLAPQPRGLQHVGLVDAGDLRPRGPERGARDALDLLVVYEQTSDAEVAVRVFSPK